MHTHEPDDIEEWLAETAPVLKRKIEVTVVGGKAWISESNPFLDYAKRSGYQPPLDVEQALATMSIGSIHATQLSATASLLNAGLDTDAVIERVIDATAAAVGDYGTRWNWTRERRALQAMCDTWLAKHPRSADQRTGETAASPEETLIGETRTTVVNLAAARKQREPKRAKQTALHVVLAEALLAVFEERGVALLFTDSGAYRYTDHLWKLQTDAAMKSWLETNLQTAARSLAMEVTNRLIAEARNWIMRHDDLHRSDVAWDAHGQVPTRSGLVNPRTLELTPAAPEHYCTWRIDCQFLALAECPLWLQMLDDVFADYDAAGRALHVQLLQEMLGAGLVDHKPKALARALIFKGGSNTGKSGLLEVMGGLYSDACNSTPLDMLGGAHALMPFARRVPWVLHEAFDQRWHMSNVVKALISGDDVQINVKGGPQYTHRFCAPIFWGTNHPPQFKEATRAITNRIVVIETRREFDPDQPVGVALEAQQRGFGRPSDLVLASELPGLLAWALAGLARALARGNLVLPSEARVAESDIRRDANLVLGFIEDCTDYDHETRVSVPDFSAAFASWWLESRGDDSRHVPSSDSIGRAIKALGDPHIAFDRHELRDQYRRYYAGLRLNEEGMRHWHNAVASEAFIFQGRKASTTEMTGNPNNAIPVSWEAKVCVRAMRMAHGVSSVIDVSPRRSSTQPPDRQEEPPF